MKPTLLEYTDFNEWSTISSFVSDYLTIILLEEPTRLPSTVQARFYLKNVFSDQKVSLDLV